MSKPMFDADALIAMFQNASAKGGAQVRKTVCDATLQALQGRELTLKNIRGALKSVSDAANKGLAHLQRVGAQAEQQRNERFLRAEHRAAQAPVRVLFPLIVFIFPGTLAIVLFPVVSRMMAEVSRWQ